MLVRGDRRAVVVGALGAVVLNAYPLAALAHTAGGLAALVQDVLRSQKAWETVVDPSTQVYGVDTPALVSRLIGRRLTSGAYLAVTITLLTLTAMALRSLARSGGGEKIARLSDTVVCLGVLVSLHHQAYDLVLLVAPVIALVESALPGDFVGERRRTALLAAFCALGMNYVTTLSVLHGLKQHVAVWVILASLNGALLLAVFVLYVLPIMTRSNREATLSVPAALAT